MKQMIKPWDWHEEYYLEYYDKNNKRYFTKYYSDFDDAEDFKRSLEKQGYKDIKIITFRY